MRIGTVYAIGSASFAGESTQPLPLKVEGKEVKLVLTSDEKILYQKQNIDCVVSSKADKGGILFSGEEKNTAVYLTNKRLILIKTPKISFPLPWFSEARRITVEKAKQRYGGKDFCDIALYEIAVLQKEATKLISLLIVGNGRKYLLTADTIGMVTVKRNIESTSFEKLLKDKIVKVEKKGHISKKEVLCYTTANTDSIEWGKIKDLPVKTIAPTQPVNVKKMIKKGRTLLGRIGIICMFAGVAILLPMILVIHLALRSNPVLLCSLIIFPWLLIIIGYYFIKKS